MNTFDGHSPLLIVHFSGFAVLTPQKENRKEEIRQRWAPFTPETQVYLDWLMQRYGEDHAQGVAVVLVREMTDQARMAGQQRIAELEQERGRLREKQLARVEKLKARITHLEQEQVQQSTQPENTPNVEACLEKLTQAGHRIEKLERQVEIQRQRLGQYYQRFYPSSLAVATERLLALGAAVNYRRLIKYNDLTVEIASGAEAWRECATHADVETLSLAIL